MKEESVNIFLDSNIIISDFFWRNSFSKSFLDLNFKSKNINIYISDLVFDEVYSFYRRNLKNSFDTINNSLKNINSRFLTSNFYEISFKSTNVHVKDLISFYDKKTQEGTFIKIEIKNNILPQITDKAIQRTPPFFSDKKQEFRDALIWFNYVDYIIDNNLKNCFFLSNNKRDFWNDAKDDLHPNLKNDLTDIKVYDSIKNLILKENRILKIKDKTEISDWLKKQNIDNDYFKSYIEKTLKESLFKKLKDLILEKDLKKFLRDNELMAFKIIDYDKNFLIEGYELVSIENYVLANVYVSFESTGEEYKAKYFNNITNKIDPSINKYKVIINLTLKMKKDEVHRPKEIELFGIIKK